MHASGKVDGHGEARSEEARFPEERREERTTRQVRSSLAFAEAEDVESRAHQ